MSKEPKTKYNFERLTHVFTNPLLGEIGTVIRN